MAEQKQAKEISQSPRISVVNGENLRIEFRIEELVNQLTRHAPSINPVASCNGCNGCTT